MDAIAIRDNIRQSIARITGISPEDISDYSDFVDDLGLDSLSLLEVAVDAELAFQIKLDDARLKELKNIDDTARVVAEYLTVDARA